MEIIPERLTECREKLGISKQETSRRIGVSQPAYLRYESGQRSPSAQVVKEIAKILHTSADYLSGKSDVSVPDLIEIKKEENQELFLIFEQLTSMDEKQKQRVLKYIEELSGPKEK